MIATLAKMSANETVTAKAPITSGVLIFDKINQKRYPVVSEVIICIDMYVAPSPIICSLVFGITLLAIPLQRLYYSLLVFPYYCLLSIMILVKHYNI